MRFEIFFSSGSITSIYTGFIVNLLQWASILGALDQPIVVLLKS